MTIHFLLFHWVIRMNNTYLTGNLDNFLELTDMLREVQDRFISELIHSSFLIAVDEKYNPVCMSINGEKYAFIFTSTEEFEKTYPHDDVSSLEAELSALMDVIKPFRLGGFILNASTQNFCLTKNFLKGLDDIPSCIICSSKAYSSEELKNLRKSIDNEALENFIRTSDDYMEFFRIMSSSVLFAIAESESDMDILEHDGIVDTFGLDHKYDYYIHENHVALFTGEDKIECIESSKFRYLSLVNFASLVHYSINRELEGIVINPGEDDYIVPIDVLIENWALINQTCFDERLVSASHSLFQI